MKTTGHPPPTGDHRWAIVDARLRRFGYRAHALIEGLHAIQQSFGYLDPVALRWIARSLRLPPSRVYGVATFYNFFSLRPPGAHLCVVCLGTACYVKGGAGILAALESQTGIRAGQTTRDGRLSLLTARCMGACGIAPAMVCNGAVVGRLTPARAQSTLLDRLAHDA